MLIERITSPDYLKQRMADCGRDNFSIQGYEAIIDSFDDGSGLDVEFDPIMLDCTYVEYDLTDAKDIDTLLYDYKYLVGDEFDGMSEDDQLAAVKQAISEDTLVLCDTATCFLFDYNF